MAFSFRKAGQPGTLTRLLSCSEEAWAELPEPDKALSDDIPTHRCPSYSHHPRTADFYPGINKPVAVADWLAHTDVADEDYILLIDADMIMRRPVLPQELGAAPGTAVSGFFGYMRGVDNELALRHVPEVEPRMDDVAGPVGRRGDQVGGFTLMQAGDMRRVAPWWIKYSEDVRADPLAWNLTGDVYAHEDEPPWIAEMYGYSFGAAKTDVWHIADRTFQLYPGYEVGPEHVQSPPKVLHYGILWNVTRGAVPEDFQFDKHWFEQFDALSCPPWQLSQDPHRSTQGLFPHPPPPSQLNRSSGYAYLRDLLSIEVLATLNAAFCERYRRVCPASEQLEVECGKAEALARELDEAFASFVPPDACLLYVCDSLSN
ncbi:peptidyl serine alpha-galactosyltransferase [Micractinium conductrix]|uniref:Peptidyl serine alpha-galactosyltransferase n=1 Tax=Micractinium conductrix TaxID=554055 RepID=A0A2P6V4K2_9CHLO|nr:peptidyl serine alpha-galactosyltransferase [Micractinium conductrix]|eukprot:PSC69020.1 peptidyl serine alpha-galactosyltransferase [Micractinium conductrix]